MGMPLVSCLDQLTRRGQTWFLTSASIAALPRPAHGGNFLRDLLICCRRSCFSQKRLGLLPSSLFLENYFLPATSSLACARCNAFSASSFPSRPDFFKSASAFFLAALAPSVSL